MRIHLHLFLAVTLAAAVPLSARAQVKGPVLAVFAHPDDERVVGPLLSRLAREGRETHLVIATDGSQGVRDFAQIPAGAELAHSGSLTTPAAIRIRSPLPPTRTPGRRASGWALTPIIGTAARPILPC